MADDTSNRDMSSSSETAEETAGEMEHGPAPLVEAAAEETPAVSKNGNGRLVPSCGMWAKYQLTWQDGDEVLARWLCADHLQFGKGHGHAAVKEIPEGLATCDYIPGSEPAAPEEKSAPETESEDSAPSDAPAAEDGSEDTMHEGEEPGRPYAAVPTDVSFQTDEGDARGFLLADDLSRIADRLIDQYSVKFSHLVDLRIEYLWKRYGGRRNGRAVVGQVQKAPPVLSAIAGERIDFFIWLAADHTRSMTLTNRQVEACLFHQMRHIMVDDDTSFLGAHDLEAFEDDIREYGSDAPGMKEWWSHFQQLPLFQ